MQAKDLEKQVDIADVEIYENSRFVKYLSESSMVQGKRSHNVSLKTLVDMVAELNWLEKKVIETRENILKKINENI